jgi:hypothetical protein
MLQRLISVATAALISFGGAGVVKSQSQTDSEARRIETIKSKVAKVGTGKKVEVKLLSNQKLIGTVDVIGDDQFTLIESPRRAPIPLRYQQVKSIKKPGGDWGSFAVLVGIVAGVIGITALGLRGG